jgi:hypothetical protein
VLTGRHVGIRVREDLLAGLLGKFLNFILYAERPDAVVADELPVRSNRIDYPSI